MRIKTFIINLKCRNDRLLHVRNQFKGETGFSIEIVRAIKHETGAIGLWRTMRKIVKGAREQNFPFILICEDDHMFTENYDFMKLSESIKNANSMNADLLLGGISNLEDSIPLANGMFWLSGFSGTQFTIIFRRFYTKFLSIELAQHENIDLRMKYESESIFCIFPFISIQKNFGYSDVTLRNNDDSAVERYFLDAMTRMDLLATLKGRLKEIANPVHHKF